MKRSILAAATVILSVAAIAPAQARGYDALLGFGLGVGVATCCGWPYYAPYSYGYGYPAYYYAPPPPTVVYAQPAPVMTYMAPPALSASQASPVYIDQQGRSCRKFQSSIEGTPVSGTACLQADGTWHTVGE